MLRGELAPFVGSGSSSQVLLNGPPVLLAPLTAQPLSMALHELATNAAKYGSLSVPDGTLDLSWHDDPPGSRLRLRWKETGGPPVAGTPERRGFGSRVVETTVRDQLRGEVSFTWRPPAWCATSTSRCIGWPRRPEGSGRRRAAAGRGPRRGAR
jgi:two-component sensor histidine kinase